MTEAENFSAEIKALRRKAVEYAAMADEFADAKRFMDAQQHLRRANELVLEALKLEQSLTTA